MLTQKKDVFQHRKRYENWKKKVVITGVIGVSKNNSETLLRYIFDMEIGANVSRKNKKGARSYARLNGLKQRISQIMRMIEERGIKNIVDIDEQTITRFFSEMRCGIIKTHKGKPYKSSQDYIKAFKAFWHWHMKVEKKNKNRIDDITEDLDTSMEKQPDFVHIKKEQLDEYLDYYDEEEKLFFTEEEKTCLLFCFDSLIRSPTELFSIKVCDIYKKDMEVWTNIPEEVAKTFGRQFNLLYSGEKVLKHIERRGLKSNHYLFNLSPHTITRKMQKIAIAKFGNGIADVRSGGKWKTITLYDLRHSGAINLRVLAKSNPTISLDSIRQRAGWTNFRMLNYYTKMIGLDGHIPALSIKKTDEQLVEIGIDKEFLKRKFTEVLESQITTINKSFETALTSMQMANNQSNYSQTQLMG